MPRGWPALDCSVSSCSPAHRCPAEAWPPQRASHLPWPASEERTRHPPNGGQVIRSRSRTRSSKGPGAIGADRRISAALALAIVDNFLYGYLVVAIVLLGERTFGAGDRGVGWLNTAFALGAFASMLVTPRLAGAGREPLVLVVTLSLFVTASAGAALAPSL
jgi:hypothetical protein